MGGKKKKKGKKKAKKEKKEGDGEDEEYVDKYKVELPHYGWIRVMFRLCDPPTQVEKYNSFKVVMRSNDRVMELK